MRRMGYEVLHSLHMGTCGIADMNIVAPTSPALCCEVRAEDAHNIPFTQGRLNSDFDKMRCSCSGLTRSQIWIRSRNIVISERAVIEVMRCRDIPEHPFGHQL